jgi:hypothetical protein
MIRQLAPSRRAQALFSFFCSQPQTDLPKVRILMALEQITSAFGMLFHMEKGHFSAQAYLLSGPVSSLYL